MKNKPSSDDQTQYLPLGMCLGVAIGTALGVALDKLSICLPIGLSIGLCIGTFWDAKNRSKTDGNSSADSTDTNTSDEE